MRSTIAGTRDGTELASVSVSTVGAPLETSVVFVAHQPAQTWLRTLSGYPAKPGDSPKGTAAAARTSLRNASGYWFNGQDIDLVNWLGITEEMGVEFRAHLLRSTTEGAIAYRTANVYLTMARLFLRWLNRRDQSIELNLAAAALKAIPSTELAAGDGRYIERNEIDAQRAVIDAMAPNRRARDRAILALLRSGLRRGEICGLKVDSFNPKTGDLTFRGKRNKARIVPTFNGNRLALVEYMEARKDLSTVNLIVGVTRNDRFIDRPAPISTHAIAAAVQSWTPEGAPRCHDYRRTAITDHLIASNCDYAATAEFSGHSSIQMVATYYQHAKQRSRAAVEKMST